MSYAMTNQPQVRDAFWEAHPEFTRQGNRTQNQYPADIRMAFVFYVDMLSKDGSISEALASRATL